MSQSHFNRRQLLGLGAASLGALALTRAAQAQEQTPLTAAAPAPDTAASPAPASIAPGEAPKALSLSSLDAGLLTTALGVEAVGAALYAQVLGAQSQRAYLPQTALDAMTQIAASKAANVATIAGALGQSAPDASSFKFPPTAFVSPIGAAWLGYSLEEIAIGSHLDALQKVRARVLRPAVATIVSTDAGHAALLRSLAGFQFSPRYFEAKLSPDQVETLLAKYRG